MTYGGLQQWAWRRLLASDSLPARLFALRVLPVDELLRFEPGRLLFPWLWAVSRGGVAPEQLSWVSRTPLAMARFLARRRPHEWRVRRSRSECAEAMVAAEHPLKTLACAVRLLDLYGEHAIQPLLEVLRHHPPHALVLGDEKAECAAWALGRLGRIAVPEILQRYQGASARVRGHLAMACWYMGSEAARAIPALLRDKSPESAAALLAMEEAASCQMVAARRGPVWLDSQAVQELAAIALSDEDRAYAAVSLACFGPDAVSGLPLLLYLARDPDVEVRRALVTSVAWGGRPETLPVMLALFEDPDVGHMVSLDSFFESEAHAREALFDRLLLGPPAEKALAASQLVRLGLPADRGKDIDALLASSSDAVLVYLLQALPAGHEEAVARLLRESPSVEVRRIAVAVAPPTALVEALWDEDVHVVRTAHTRLAPFELGERAPTLPELTMVRLLLSDNYAPGVDELLSILQHGGFEARRHAARRLGRRGEAHSEVIDALRAGLQEVYLELECAQALVLLGDVEYAWMMLGSSTPQDRELALHLLLQKEAVPTGLMEKIASGHLVNQQSLRLCRSLLPPSEHAGLLAEALVHVEEAAVGLVSRELELLRTATLDLMSELLEHRNAAVQNRCLMILENILRPPLDETVEWILNHGLVLPLEHRQVHIRRKLHEVLATFLLVARAGQFERALPLLKVLSRSPYERAAAAAVQALGRGLATYPNPRALSLLVEAASHRELPVRREALFVLLSAFPTKSAARQELARTLAGLPEDSDGLVELRKLAILQKARGLTLNEWRRALGCLARVDGWRDLVLPTCTSELVQLTSLLADSQRGVSSEAFRLLHGFPGAVEQPLWRALSRALDDPAASLHHGAMLRRWPQLLRRRLHRAAGFGEAAEPGLMLALHHRSRRFRLQAVAAAEALRMLGQPLRRELITVREHDPDPEVRAAAERAFWATDLRVED